MNFHAGQPGVWLTDEGASFCVFSGDSQAVFLCLIDEADKEFCYPMTRRGDLWSLTVEGVRHGQCYGYRVHGEQDAFGSLKDPSRLLLDPYARAIVGMPPKSQREEVVLKSRLLDTAALPPFVHPKPERRLEHSVLYELHVKGFSMSFPGIRDEHRGRFLAFTEPKVLDYLANLGITAVELMPCQQFFHEPFLTDKGLTNYWGYNSIGFFAPHSDYGDIGDFRAMVDALHSRGIEVILDVVYNHTAEGGAEGPVYSFKALDNAAYYRLTEGGGYINDTGCGNTLNLNHPRVLELVMDSLRYWSEVGGVDGFRFDLAACLGRTSTGFDVMSGFFAAIGQDPQLKRLKLIAEPWDVGPGGYRLGEFPMAFSEWNDRYRDAIRRLWRGDETMLGEFARRFHGSADLFEASLRGPWASLNFITSHDGFTLRDLLSYTERHNEANLEDNRDGHRENLSQNQGVEGEAPELEPLRQHKARAMLMTLLCSFGVPMLRAGDELWQTQKGNNNAYCQDNPLTWIDWENADQDFAEFVRELIAIRRSLPLLGAERYIHSTSAEDGRKGRFLAWFNERGEPMQDADWQGAAKRELKAGITPAARALHEPTPLAQAIGDAVGAEPNFYDVSPDACRASSGALECVSTQKVAPEEEQAIVAEAIQGTTGLIAAFGEHHPLRGEQLLLFVINPGSDDRILRLPSFSLWSQLTVLCSNAADSASSPDNNLDGSSLIQGRMVQSGSCVYLPAFGAALLQSVSTAAGGAQFPESQQQAADDEGSNP